MKNKQSFPGSFSECLMEREKFIASTELREPAAKRKYGYCSHENVTLNSSTTDIKITNRTMEIKVFSWSHKNSTSINVSLNPSKNFKKQYGWKNNRKSCFQKKDCLIATIISTSTGCSLGKLDVENIQNLAVCRQHSLVQQISPALMSVACKNTHSVLVCAGAVSTYCWLPARFPPACRRAVTQTPARHRAWWTRGNWLHGRRPEPALRPLTMDLCNWEGKQRHGLLMSAVTNVLWEIYFILYAYWQLQAQHICSADLLDWTVARATLKTSEQTPNLCAH